mmetsp:Transcript_43137/g.133297  ORF Transcript_43137/g.133297 Transcript_43137/m.133297 type:complete len:305 (+) Transcript_43137:140-1054(+)
MRLRVGQPEASSLAGRSPDSTTSARSRGKAVHDAIAETAGTVRLTRLAAHVAMSVSKLGEGIGGPRAVWIMWISRIVAAAPMKPDTSMRLVHLTTARRGHAPLAKESSKNGPGSIGVYGRNASWSALSSSCSSDNGRPATAFANGSRTLLEIERRFKLGNSARKSVPMGSGWVARRMIRVFNHRVGPLSPSHHWPPGTSSSSNTRRLVKPRTCTCTFGGGRAKSADDRGRSMKCASVTFAWSDSAAAIADPTSLLLMSPTSRCDTVRWALTNRATALAFVTRSTQTVRIGALLSRMASKSRTSG